MKSDFFDCKHFSKNLLFLYVFHSVKHVDAVRELVIIACLAYVSAHYSVDMVALQQLASTRYLWYFVDMSGDICLACHACCWLYCDGLLYVGIG